jgi:hypothetical protein
MALSGLSAGSRNGLAVPDTEGVKLQTPCRAHHICSDQQKRCCLDPFARLKKPGEHLTVWEVVTDWRKRVREVPDLPAVLAAAGGMARSSPVRCRPGGAAACGTG